MRKKYRKHKKESKKIILIIIFLLLILAFYYFIKNNSLINKKITEPITATTVNNLTTGKISYENRKRKDELEKFTYNIEYPYFNISFVDQDIDNFITDSFKEFEQDVFKSEILNGVKYSFDITFVPYLINSNFVSIRFTVSTYLGGAHGIHQIFTKNYDIKSKKEINLASFFKNDEYLKYISEKAVAQFVSDEISNESWIKEGAGPKYDNFKNFNFSEDGNNLIFHFSHYQVAPYYKGIISFSVPIAELKEFMK